MGVPFSLDEEGSWDEDGGAEEDEEGGTEEEEGGGTEEEDEGGTDDEDSVGGMEELPLVLEGSGMEEEVVGSDTGTGVVDDAAEEEIEGESDEDERAEGLKEEWVVLAGVADVSVLVNEEEVSRGVSVADGVGDGEDMSRKEAGKEEKEKREWEDEILRRER